MTARRSEDPAARGRTGEGADAAAYWTPRRRREARPARVQKVPSSESSPESAEPAQEDFEDSAEDADVAGTSGDAPGAETPDEAVADPSTPSERPEEK